MIRWTPYGLATIPHIQWRLDRHSVGKNPLVLGMVVRPTYIIMSGNCSRGSDAIKGATELPSQGLTKRGAQEVASHRFRASLN